MTKIAIIDMGTNTFHLLLAEVGLTGYRIFHREHAGVKIGMAGINEGLISESASQRALETMKRFRQTIDHFGVSTIHAIGTSALRNAKNAQALADEVRNTTGISIQVISGDEEAGYIFEGVRCAMDLGTDVNLVMDIGAGSVEFIVGDRHKVFWKQSFEIGGQRLLEKFQKHDPILKEEIQALESYLESALGDLFTALEDFRPSVLIGSSGTFDTLSDIFRIRKRISRNIDASETPLSLEGFHEIYQELIRKNRSERMQIEGMVDLRVDLIIVGCCLIHFLLKKHQFDRIRVSTYSLKEGVLAKLAVNFSNA